MPRVSDFLPNGFNLNATENTSMFDSPTPKSLVMPVMCMTVPGVDQTRALREMEKVENTIDLIAAQCAHGSLVEQSKRLPDGFAIGCGDLQGVTWSIMPLAAKAWAVDGIYVEAGYHIASVPSSRDVVSLVSDAMMLYDVQVAASGSMEPLDHQPLVVGERFANEFSQAMGDLYRSNIAIWRRELLNHRTMILIICRAVMMGRDPVREYQRFINVGGTYFLDYPALCP